VTNALEVDRRLGQLVYASASAPGFELSDLENVLRVARDRNTRAEVTGMLLFESSSFLQVLEGETDRLNVLYDKIVKDPRHTRAVLLLREPIDERSFVDWTMGYTHVSLGELHEATGINEFFRDGDAFSDLNSEKVGRVLDLFRSGAFRQRLR
jgi:hypothetical protein